MNWRDDNPQRRSIADSNERDRVAGMRESTRREPREPDLHDDDLPVVYRHAPPTPIVRPPAPAAGLPMPEHYITTMTTCQLRERIAQMEYTSLQYKGGIHRVSGRKEKPSERHEREGKLSSYKQQLAIREANDAREAATSKAYNARLDRAAADKLEREAATTAAGDRALMAERIAAGDASRAAAQSARVDPADVPQLVKCNRCGLLVAQDAAGDMLAHLAIGQTKCPAKCTEWSKPRTNPNFAHRTAEPAPQHQPTTQAAQIAPEPRTAKCSQAGCSSQTYNSDGLCSFHRAQEDAEEARIDAQHAAEEAAATAAALADREALRAKIETDKAAASQAKHDARLQTACRECHAAPGEPCKNYAGQHCAPHGVRKADAKPAARPTAAADLIAKAQAAGAAAQAEGTAALERRATVTEIPPPPPAAAAEIATATAERKATVAHAAELTALDIAVEALVKEHTSGAVIDAAWSAAHRLFNPRRQA